MVEFSIENWEKMTGKKIINDEGARIKHRIDEKIRRFKKLIVKKKQEYKLLEKLWDDPVITGLLLSDAHLRSIKDGQQSCFILDVKEENKEMIDFVAEYLTDFGIGSCIDRQLHNGRFWSIRVTSYRNFAFTELRKRWYKQNKKIVPYDIQLTEKCTAFWFMGDGTSSKNTSGRVQVAFYTNGFMVEDIKILKTKLDFLDVPMIIRSRVIKNCNPCHVMEISRKKDVIKLMELIEPYMLNCFKYKVKYPSTKEQQREVIKIGNS